MSMPTGWLWRKSTKDEWNYRHGAENPANSFGPIEAIALYEGKEPVVAFEDPRVQAVYAILCDDTMPPNPEEHWEGWQARRIVEALAAIREVAADEEIADRLNKHVGFYTVNANDVAFIRGLVQAQARELDKKDDISLVEAYKMARTRLERFADEANAGRVHCDARELKRKIWGAFADADALPDSSAWQNANTAPKDGSEIYFLRKPPYGATGNICIGFWHDGQNEPCFVAAGTSHRIDLNVWSRWKPVETYIDLEKNDHVFDSKTD